MGHRTCTVCYSIADEISREVTLALSPWAVESEKGLRASQVGTASETGPGIGG